MPQGCRVPQMRDFGAPYLVKVFGVAVVAGLILMLLPDKLTETTEIPTAIEHYGERRLATLGEETANGTVGIVVLGDSRLLYGTHPDERFSRDLSGTDRSVSVVRLSLGAATIRDFVSLADDIAAADPTLVVIQDDLFERFESRPEREISRRDSLLWKHLGGDYWNPYDNLFPLNDEWSECPPGRLNEVSRPEALDMILEAQAVTGMEYRTEGEHIEQLTSFLDEVHAASITVAVLTIPESDLAMEKIQRLSRTPTGLRLGAEAIVADENYCDGSHLSPAGREQYVAQLAPEINALLDALDEGRPLDGLAFFEPLGGGE